MFNKKQKIPLAQKQKKEFGEWIIRVKFQHDPWLDDCGAENIYDIIKVHEQNGTSPVKIKLQDLESLFELKNTIKFTENAWTFGEEDISTDSEKTTNIDGSQTYKEIVQNLEVKVTPQAVQATVKNSLSKIKKYVTVDEEKDYDLPTPDRFNEMIEDAIDFYIELMFETKEGKSLVSKLEEYGMPEGTVSLLESESNKISEAYIIAHLFEKLFTLGDSNNIAGEQYVRLFLEQEAIEDELSLHSFHYVLSKC